MLAITLVTFIPSVFIGLHMVRVSIFEVQADKYIAQVFNFPQTRVIESSKIYRRGGESPRIELLLVGEPLGEDVIENARGQLASYGLPRTELVVRQASNSDKVDLQSLQSSYVELLDEKNRQIAEMKQRLARYQVTNVDIGDISQEVGVMSDNVESIVAYQRGDVRRCGQTAGYAVGLCHYAEGFPTPDRPGAVAQVAFGPHEGR